MIYNVKHDSIVNSIYIQTPRYSLFEKLDIHGITWISLYATRNNKWPSILALATSGNDFQSKWWIIFIKNQNNICAKCSFVSISIAETFYFVRHARRRFSVMYKLLYGQPSEKMLNIIRKYQTRKKGILEGI